ncbi:MAG TPA: hypothetical protein VF834_18635, partial [Streptosporangiaceae bacterium]
HNPTFVYGHPSENYLAVHAPMPPQCDKAGQGPCTGTTNGNKNNGGGSNPSPSPSSSGSSSPGSSPGPGGSSPGGSPSVNPVTGQTYGPGTTSYTGGGQASAVPAVLASGQGRAINDVLGPLAVALLLIALIAPPVLYWRWSSRQGRAL